MNGRDEHPPAERVPVGADTRYNRQEAVPSIGADGQRRLAQASVAVVGAGGVKSPTLLYLAAAGIGHLRIIDFDRVELSNLNRQILYTTGDIGRFKSEAAADRLRALNPDIRIEPVTQRLSEERFDELLGGFDVLLEGGNSAQERVAFNRAALRRGQPYVHASAQYNYSYVFTVVPGTGACFECVFDDLPRTHGGPVPVTGPAVGVAGSVAAGEVMNLLLRGRAQLTDRVWFFDGWRSQAVDLQTAANPACPACAPPALGETCRTGDMAGASCW